VSLDDGSKGVENGKSWIYFASRTSSCRLSVCILGSATRSISRLCYGNVAGWLCTCFNELFVTAYVDNILNTDNNK